MFFTGIKASIFKDMTWESGFSNFCKSKSSQILLNAFETVERVGVFSWLFRKMGHYPI